MGSSRGLLLMSRRLGLGRAFSARPVQLDVVAGKGESMIGGDAVSYTHLTLPTIYSV